METMEQSEHYKYVSLETALTCVNQKVNFYGVIAEFEPPKPTKGSDMICTMTIKDMSQHSPGLRLIVFAYDLGKLPHVRSAGDIIRLHRAKIEGHNNGINAVAKINVASFLLFEGKGGVDYRPYQSSSTKFTLMNHDEKIIHQLREWSANYPIETDVNEYLLPMKGIKEGIYFDLCCKILYVQEVFQNTTIYVWDGTDAPPRELEMKEEDKIASHFDLIEASSLVSLSRDVLCKFPVVGTILRICTDININEFQQRLLRIGNWVKLRNITCRVKSGMWEGVMTSTSKIYSISIDMEERLERSFASRLESESGRLPQWCPRCLNSVTVTDYDGNVYSTLMEVITHPQDKFFNGHAATNFKSSSESLTRLKAKFHTLLGFIKCINNEGENPCRFRSPPWVKCCIKSYYLNKNSPWESRRYRIFGTTLLG